MLTPEAKKLLAETIRGSAQNAEKGLRARLLRAIHDEADRRYRLSVPIGDAGLDEVHRRRRERIEAWIDERVRATRPEGKAELRAAQARLLAQAEKEAAATLVNRLVLLRHLEALGLSRPAVLTGGWNSKGYREFREFAPTLCTNGTADASEGYATLLQLLFDELAVDLPGLFGDVGLTRLFAIPAATLREVVERLDDPELSSAWTDDTTLGWVYQYWNDPDREALDAKINGGGKIEPHEIASKTQMFTERYMVEWLLQNSLGLMWLCMCRKNGWTADAERVVGTLETRREAWRGRREAGDVALDALMPIEGGEGGLEDRWKYYVPQPLPEDAVEKAPASVRSLKILDPACGSGHFLVIAFGLMAALYREEARHRGEAIGDREIAESILENNLHGIDIDPRAIQIAAAGLYLKARSLAKDARPRRLNLVAPVLQVGSLPADDPAVVYLREDLKREAGIPEELTNRLLTSLAGVDYLGSLLKVDAAVEDAIRAQDAALKAASQRSFVFVSDDPEETVIVEGSGPDALFASDPKATVIDRLEEFLSKHSRSEDLGLRLDGEQLAVGVRFVRIAKEGAYDIVVGNPPYQGLTKTESFGYVTKTYPRGKADLYAAFLERGLELAKPGGMSALLTMRGWMFLGQFAELRKHLLATHDLRAIGDFDRGAFDEVPNELLAVTVSILRRGSRPNVASVALLPTPLDDKSYDRDRTDRKRAAVLAHVGRYEFDPRGFEVIEGEPIVYWWSSEFLSRYARAPKLGNLAAPRQGLASSDNIRFLLRPWEIQPRSWRAYLAFEEFSELGSNAFVPFVKGAAGRAWLEPFDDVIRWENAGLEVRVLAQHLYGSYTRTIKNESYYFRPGVAFSMIGSAFTARAHRYASVIADKGSSVYGLSRDQITCLLNSRTAKDVLSGLNPTISFQVGDVKRLPCFFVSSSDAIFARLNSAFEQHEAGRETSVEYRCPRPSAWRYCQVWAQLAVDRHEGAAVPSYEPEEDSPPSEAEVSFSLGIALGRFEANGAGILAAPQSIGLPTGSLFVSAESADSLEQPACDAIHVAWKEHGAAVGGGDDLRTYLRKSFFDYHKKLYENRPIYFPLSSSKKNFVAFVSIHRWQDDTLNVLLADHLIPAKRRLEGELDDLRTARAAGNNKGKTEKRFTDVQKLLEELSDFIAKITEVAEKGPPQPDDKTPPRSADARYVMDLDDGVMVNSAALWPLFEPQWKDPKKWWKELATAKGKKDYDWSHLAARYFPARVRDKCTTDPSLAVAHKCFWELHPAKAYAWELRLQDEIRPDFTIDEPASDAARAAFLAARAQEAADLRAAEQKRRARKAARADEESDQQALALADPADPEDPTAAEDADD